MKKIKLLLLFLLIGITMKSQTIKLGGGLNYNDYFELSNPEDVSVSYGDGVGFHFAIGLQEIKRGVNRKGINKYIDLALFYDRYFGDASNSESSLCCSRSERLSIQKDILGLSLYLINPVLYRKGIVLGFGTECSILLAGSAKGTGSFRGLGMGTVQRIINMNNRSDFPGVRVGFNTKLAYKIRINELMYVLPAYDLSIGLTQELKSFAAYPRSMIHRFTISIERALSNSKKQ